MKKTLLFSLLIVGISLSHAQGLKIGLKGGLNFPTVDAIGVSDGVDVSDTENASGYHIGAFARFKFSKLAVQPEVLYSFQSIDFTQVNPLNQNQDFDITQKLSYLTVPVMVRLYLVAGLNLQVGPQFGILLDGTQEDDFQGPVTSSDIKDNLKNSDIGLNLGAGWDLPFGLDIHARYTIGLQDVNDVAGAEDAKNSMIQISIGYALVNLGK